MTAAPISDRMKDFFIRHIAWLEELLAGFETFEDDLSENELQGMLDRQQQNARKTQDFSDEFNALWKEWEASYDWLPANQREEVAVLARRTEDLSLRLADLSDHAAGRVDEELTRVKESILVARRSRENLKRFGQGSGPDPGFMDTKV